jgi:hypothetical protein
MKNLILPAILSAMIFASCSKKTDVTIANPVVTATTAKDTSTISTDNLIHTIVFNMGLQVVKTSVTNQTLTLQFNENVNMYITADGLGQSYSIHLFENFQQSQLAGLDFTTVNQSGVPTLDWVDDNLNNVILKTVSDTLVNNVPIKKINVSRPFTFTKTFDSNQSAINQQNTLLNQYNDKVSYKAYCYFNQKTYVADSVSVNMVYVRK